MFELIRVAVPFMARPPPCKSKASTFHRGNGRLGRLKMQALTCCDAEVVSTRAHSSRSVQGLLQWGDGTLHMGSIRGKAHPLPHTNMATVSKPVGRWNVRHGFDSRESSPPATHTYYDGQHTSGAMDESSGQGQKASTRKKPRCHGYRSLQN